MTAPTGRTALAFDPHPGGYTWGVVRERDGARRGAVGSYERVDAATFEGKGLRAGRLEFVRLLETYAPDVIAVEGMAGFLSAERQGRQRSSAIDISELMNTAIWAGVLIGWAPDSAAVKSLPANAKGRSGQSWRYLLTGKHTAGDADVAQALDAFLHGGLKVRSVQQRAVKGAPGVKARTVVYADNDHKRDAMGLGIVSLRF